jgi:predicted AAA+ superfamily ATPase
VWTGGYPRIHDRRLNASEWLADYATTYVQRDVRQVLNVGDLDAFTRFLRLAATRTAQELNLSTLGGDAGVSHNTVRAWLSVLEASFVLFRLPRWHRNLRKRAVKTPKVHFVDSGLVCYLLGIRTAQQLELHPLRGAIFECWVASEVLKSRMHRGLSPDLFHLREDRGLELDLIVDAGETVYGVEVKSAATMVSDFVQNLSAFARLVAAKEPHVKAIPRLVYGGDVHEERSSVQIVPWDRIQSAAW